MKTNIKYLPIWGMLLLFFSACSPESENGMEESTEICNRLWIRGEIVGAAVATKADGTSTDAGTDTDAGESTDPGTGGDVKAKFDVLGSYTEFVEGSEIGFFSFHKNGCDGDHTNGEGDESATATPTYYQNRKLTYTAEKKFEDLEGPSDGPVFLPSLGSTFAYFPYSADKAPDDYKKLEANEFYINIFKGENVVEDILIASAVKLSTSVNYSFKHQFSMLLFYLGEGFNEEDKNAESGITVHLTQKILGAHVTRKWENGRERLTFTVDRGDVNDAGPGYSEFKTGPSIEGSDKGRAVYRVILPPGSEVDYIELKDQNQKLQKVRLPKTVLPKLESGYKYPLTIKMDGVEPTVYPHSISKWEEKEGVEIPEPAGIRSLEELQGWITLYNDEDNQQHLEDEDNVNNPFTKYGTKENGHWTFYIRANIDCANLTDEDGVLIDELGENVTLDGGKYVLSNLTLKAAPGGNAGIIGNMKGNLKGLRLENVTVIGGGSGTSAGCIAAIISGGQVLDCTVKMANMTGSGFVGVLAGTMSGGVANRCRFRGMVMAPLHLSAGQQKTYQGIVGKMEAEAAFGGDIINQVNFVKK